jgi:tRNA nucleotidyltransferase (CCA-adding enzyme)
VKRIAARLLEAGHRSWVVGGSVRDVLLEERGQVRASAGDWDLATDAKPGQVKQLFSRVVPTGIKHGTVTVILDKVPYEVTTLRGEVGYSDGRHPDAVYFVDDIREDLARRDFTVNAIAYDIEADRLIDPFGGVADLHAGRLRAVGIARERFEEDGLRVLRAARFVATLEFDLEPATAAAIEPSLGSYRKVSAERIRDEWLKALASRQPSRAFRVMLSHGILMETAPELARGAGARAEAWLGVSPASDRLEFAFSALDAAQDVCVRLAALLHNLLPPSGAELSAQEQAIVSSKEARALLTRLRFSNRERDDVAHLIQAHAWLAAPPESTSDRIRLLREVGRPLLPKFLELGRALFSVAGQGDDLAELEKQLLTLLESDPPLSIGDLRVSGEDLKVELGLGSGPILGELLRELLDWVTEDPARNTREHLLQAASALLRDR